MLVLGGMLARPPDTGREILAAGHEPALPGYEHRCLARRGPRGVLHSQHVAGQPDTADPARLLAVVRDGMRAAPH